MGRPRIFDEEQVVDRAMELFWTKGYEATSVSDLAAKLGVHPGSLYRTFGDKYVLFLRALARYRDSQARALAPSLLAGGPVLPRIRAVLVGFIELTAEQDKPRGWLAANTVGELLPGDRMPRAAWRMCCPMSRTASCRACARLRGRGRSPAPRTSRAGRPR